MFRDGTYHKSFQRKHTQLEHFLRGIQLRVFYSASIRLATRQGWPDPLDRTSLRVLLCGSASPHTTRAFARFVSGRQRKAHIDVLDISPYALDQSAQFLKARGETTAMDISFIEGDALSMPFADESFDWIETDFFIQFFSAAERYQIFREWRRVLRPGGIVTTRDWLTDGRTLPDRLMRRTKNWMIRHILGPTTYDASAEEVQGALKRLGLSSAVVPVRAPGIRLGIPAMKYLVGYKPLDEVTSVSR
jgi:SAM-dependent methyltransferase